MPKIEDAGNGRFLQEALEANRQKQRDMIQQLIVEKAQAEMKLRNISGKLDGLTEEKEKLESSLEMEKKKNSKFQTELRILRAEEENRKNGYKDTDDLTKLNLEEKNKVLLQKVGDLQLRLKNLVTDDLEKDGRLQSLQLKVGQQENVISQLKEHVDDDVYEAIVSKESKYDDSNVFDSRNTVGQCVIDEHKVQSKVCSIM